MALCEKHGRFFRDNEFCGACWAAGSLAKKVESKAVIKSGRFKKPIQIKASTKERTKLKNKLQSLIAKHMKTYYSERGLNYCFISGKSTNAKGIYNLHASHYFPKGVLWQLWTVPENIGLSTYDMNINKPETVGMMRNKLVQIWGEERFKELEKRAEYHKQMIAIGAEKKYPPQEWLDAKIKELTSKSFKIK